MRAVLALAGKDLRLLFRDKGDVFFTFVFPVILAIFFGFVFGGGGGSSKIALALVVESDAKIAAGIAADLAADAAFEVHRAESRDAAVDAVRAGRVAAAVVLPAAMQDGVDGLFSGRGIPVEAIVDPSHRAEAGLIQGKLNELVFRQFPRMFGDRAQMSRLFSGARRSFTESDGMSPTQKLLAAGMVAAGESFMNSLNADSAPNGDSTTPSSTTPSSATPATAWSPVAVQVAELPPRPGQPRSSFDVTFPQGLVWGLAGCISAFASSLVTERARGTLARLRLAPIGAAQLVLGKGLACFTAAIMVQALLIGLAVVGFGSSIAQPLMLAFACMAGAFAFSGLAMLLAGFCRTEAEANGAGRGAILILALIGGGSIPLFFMPPVLRTLSFGSPFRWLVAAVEGPFWRDTPISEQITPLAVLIAIGAAGFLAGVRGLGPPFGR
jgi:ABC-2 type transport system permease protein